MRTVETQAAQGDVIFIRVAEIPAEAAREQTDVVAHSETGHHHVVRGPEGAYSFFRLDTMTAYLECEAPVEIVHLRQHDTHETLRLVPGVYKVRRQREATPEGWAVVAD